jgi:hypothetical protein
MDQNTILILLTVLVIILVFVLPQILIRRAISSVIRTFHEKKALLQENARTVDDLGLRPKSMLQAIFRGTRYKTTALLILRNAGVIQTTEDRKLYLSEENLSRSKYKGQ